MLLLADTSQTNVSVTANAIAAVIEHFKRDGTPGGVVAVERDGRIVITPYGVSHLTTNMPVTADTQFEIGSVSKQFTAAAILQLAEAHKLTIDAPMGRYLPGVPHGDAITLRELLTQTSGIKDFFDRPDAARVTAHTSTDRAMYTFIAAPLAFQPGTHWQYSNTNYWLLGRIIERVSGESYNDYVRARLFARAGMMQSAFVAEEPSLRHFAQGYWHGPDGKGALQPAPAIESFWATGAGSIVSTGGDLVRWDDALRSGKIVTPESYRMMTTAGSLRDGQSTSYGMGIGLDRTDGHRSTWHNGKSNGSSAQNVVFPDDDATIVVLENSFDAAPEAAERAAFFKLFPDAELAEETPARGETSAIRQRATTIIDEVLAGDVPLDSIDAAFRSIASAQTQRQIAASLHPLGAREKMIFRGATDREGRMTYTYHVVFEHGSRNFIIVIDKASSLIYGIGIQ